MNSRGTISDLLQRLRMEDRKGSNIPKMESPVCIIENADGKLKPCEEGLKVLEQFHLPVAVVAIAGQYRTGKSYLMNRLCNQRKGFSLGTAIQSHTKGIWMWVSPHPKHPNCCLMVVDTEGLGDVKKGDANNDVWLFALAVLMSSLFVYNSMKQIDQHALSDLQLVTKLSDIIKIKTAKKENEKEDLGRIFPPFVWAIRDFTLELKMDDKDITTDEYLENCLEENKERNEEFNECRKCIKVYFPERKCFVFPQPASRKKLKNLETLKDEELDEDFVAESKNFCDYVYEHAKPKTVQGAQLNGRKLSTLLKAYVECISSGHVPSLQSAVQSLSEIENSRAVAAAETRYKELMDKVILPTKDAHELLQHHNQSEKEAIDVFTQQFFLDEDKKFQNEMKAKIQCLYEQYCITNEKESEKKCRAVLNKVAKELEEKLKKGEYIKPGGYKMFCSDRENAEMAYLGAPGKGVKTEEILLEFKSQKTSEASAILAKDDALTAQMKESEDAKQRMAESLMRNAILKEQIAQIEELLKIMMETFKINIAILMKAMEDNRERYKKDRKFFDRCTFL